MTSVYLIRQINEHNVCPYYTQSVKCKQTMLSMCQSVNVHLCYTVQMVSPNQSLCRPTMYIIDAQYHAISHYVQGTSLMHNITQSVIMYKVHH